MSERITLKRGTSTARVIAEHVERFKALGWSEPKKPAPKRTTKSRSKQEEGDE